MIKQPIGEIKEIDNIRSVFAKEDIDFTPWLNSKLSLLTQKLNLEVTDNRIEQPVGNFSCDIVAKDTLTDKQMIVENQFGDTNHDHLGKILTYAAGQDASLIIWIAERFREEHKKALEWLNENVDPNSEISFFGVEIKLIRIDNSNPAPDFNVVVKPNNWERNIKLATHLGTEREKKYVHFFTRLVEEWDKIKPKELPEPRIKSYYLKFGAGRSGLRYAWTFSRDTLLVELVVLEDEDRSILAQFQNRKSSLESELGQLTWDLVEDRKRWKVYLSRNLKGDIETLTDEDYPEVIEWATKTMYQFVKTFEKHIRQWG